MYVGNSTCVYLPPPEALWSKSHNSDKFNRYQALKRQFTQNVNSSSCGSSFFLSIFWNTECDLYSRCWFSYIKRE